MKKIQIFKNVFTRNNPWEISFEDFIHNPQTVFDLFNKDGIAIITDIAGTTNKELRNEKKRNSLPAANFEDANILCIDIDGIFDKPEKKQEIINTLRNAKNVLCVKDSPSGNLAIFFKWEGEKEDFKYIYYRAYLELTIQLSVNIDFLPEECRLRYVSFGEVHLYNTEAQPLTEPLRVENLPYINTQPNLKRGSVKYGSR